TVIGLMPSRKLHVTGGSVRLDGEDILGRDMGAIRGRRIGMIFQNPTSHLDPVMTIGNQIREGLSRHKGLDDRAAKAEAIALLTQVGFPDPPRAFASYAHQYSGGMRQRAMIAMALACNPQVVVADEPTTALDVMIQAQILELLDDLRHKLGLSVVLVTHDLGVVAEVCDTVLVMYGGVTAEYADVDTIFNDPQHPYTQQLLRAFPDLSRPTERLISIPGAPPRLDNLPPGCRFAPRCPQVFDRCHSEAPKLHRLSAGHLASCHLLDGG
ncbi:MAG: ABC transporter ATP-binding protein, partial [Anaerolineae bacterium]|nr:ABC transporter ATP-binding protein [Anaerolineae bacterium]